MLRLLSIAAALFVAACAGSPQPKLYLFDDRGQAAALSGGAAPVIGLRELALPLYARRPQVAALEPDGSITASDDHRWGEDPPRAATRVVARSLERAGGGEVYAEPWPLGVAPALIVSVEVDRMIGVVGGETVLRGEFSIARADRRGDARSAPFDIRVAATGDGYAGLTGAYSAALRRLAEEIAAAAARL